MLIVLSGPSTVGKSYCVEYLSRFLDFRSLTPYTTRRPRTSESEGFHYHFRSYGELNEMTANFSRGYWARPLNDGNVYGYTEQIDTLGPDHRLWVVQAAAEIGIAVKSKSVGVWLVFLDFADDNVMQARIDQRYHDDRESMDKRLAHAHRERSQKENFDITITSNSPEKLAQQLADYCISKVLHKPMLPANSAGPLSDIDLRSSLQDPSGLRVDGVTEETLLKRINGWSVDLTLSPRYYRVIRPGVFRRVFDLCYGSAQEMLGRFREAVATEEHGIFLKANEFVLTSTQETLHIPASMACLISGRSSYSRLGLSVELSQAILQPGHADVIPLQLKNNLPYPIVIYPGTPIVQAVFFRTLSPSQSPYDSDKRAKYPAPLDDLRSRYYSDPAYEAIRSKKPPRRSVDWDFLLNTLLFLLAWLTAASWVVTRFPDEDYQHAGRVAAVIFFAVTTLVGAIRGIRLLREYRQR